MTVPKPPSTTFVDGLEYLGQPCGRRRYRDGERIYEWDELHGEMEAYNPRGRHLGALNPEGVLTKPAVKGRRIDV